MGMEQVKAMREKKTKRTLKCLQCGYEWEPRVERPKACPECIRRDWDIPPVAGGTK